MEHSVLLFINLALVFVFCFFFTKIVSTLYTGLYSFLFSHINITHPKYGTTITSEKNQRKNKTPNKHQRRGAHPKHGLSVF